MSKPKQHHFVPEWYLRKFADQDGFLQIYDRETDLWRRQKPKKVMRRNGYYKQDWVPSGVDENILEQTFSQLEGDARNAFAKLLRWEDDLNHDEWAKVLIYLQVQRIRVPKQAEQAKALLKSLILMRGNPETSAKVLQGRWRLKVADSFRFEYMTLIGSALVKIFMRMEWKIHNAKAGSFVTTDNPVTLFNPTVYPPLEPGLGQAGTVVLFPLNPAQVLVLCHPEGGEMEADEQIPKDQLENELGFRVSEMNDPWPIDQVNRHNGIMIDSADRLVVATCKDTLESALGRSLSGHR
jgi:hypothetical protein